MIIIINDYTAILPSATADCNLTKVVGIFSLQI